MANHNVTFEDVVGTLAEQYPKRQIKIVKSFGDNIVYIDGEPKFNATGYNFLYNVMRLTKMLEDELL